MNESKEGKAQHLDQEFNEAAHQIGRAASRVVNAVEDELCKLNIEFTDLEALAKKAEKDQTERSANLGVKHEQSRQGITRQWKRY